MTWAVEDRIKIFLDLSINGIQAVVDRILSRAPKGFTKSRQIHEVINHKHQGTMDYCKKKLRQGGDCLS
jgi:hypothetical protein